LEDDPELTPVAAMLVIDPRVAEWRRPLNSFFMATFAEASDPE